MICDFYLSKALICTPLSIFHSNLWTMIQGKILCKKRTLLALCFIHLFCLQTHSTHVLPLCEAAATAPGLGSREK